MPLALPLIGVPIDGQDVIDAIVLLVAAVAGFLSAGVIGLLIGLGAGFAFIEITDELARIDDTLTHLARENETLRNRVESLEGTVAELEDALETADDPNRSDSD
ncbi:hypothetical protein SAMN05192561_10857 [Halopenitus malekzadehii]|uniref:Uncharacterized protein n=1 Tax=Halopenitus malekzadehii TaxID=1267564 RepID=A0A1H6JAB0_9EURY|nr:hypothetical protein [Halopenitus malekzadehii]SEH57288.1 hypothetical protein SAMN05192561_10857 [Halopenitus malekzadehii]